MPLQVLDIKTLRLSTSARFTLDSTTTIYEESGNPGVEVKRETAYSLEVKDHSPKPFASGVRVLANRDHFPLLRETFYTVVIDKGLSLRELRSSSSRKLPPSIIQLAPILIARGQRDALPREIWEAALASSLEYGGGGALDLPHFRPSVALALDLADRATS